MRSTKFPLEGEIEYDLLEGPEILARTVTAVMK
jgi:hypothetical protein